MVINHNRGLQKKFAGLYQDYAPRRSFVPNEIPTLPETNMALARNSFQKKLIILPLILRCYVTFRECKSSIKRIKRA